MGQRAKEKASTSERPVPLYALRIEIGRCLGCGEIASHAPLSITSKAPRISRGLPSPQDAATRSLSRLAQSKPFLNLCSSVTSQKNRLRSHPLPGGGDGPMPLALGAVLRSSQFAEERLGEPVDLSLRVRTTAPTASVAFPPHRRCRCWPAQNQGVALWRLTPFILAHSDNPTPPSLRDGPTLTLASERIIHSPQQFAPPFAAIADRLHKLKETPRLTYPPALERAFFYLFASRPNKKLSEPSPWTLSGRRRFKVA